MKAKSFITPRIALLAGDVLRVGYEDDRWHAVYRLRQHIPKSGRFFLNPVAGKVPNKGAPVFLTDRQEKALTEQLGKLEKVLAAQVAPAAAAFSCRPPRLPKSARHRMHGSEVHVYRGMPRRKAPAQMGLWLSERVAADVPKGLVARSWWWLPPVVWPANEQKISSLIARVRKKGARDFVVNAPWQQALFTGSGPLNLWAGPFCNLSNALSLDTIASMGINGAIVSPELARDDFLQLPGHSPIPLGIVMSGHWPLCVSRIISDRLNTDKPFASPRDEQAWTAKYADDYWVFPNWILDITESKSLLARAGYTMFIHLVEPVPAAVTLKKRPGLWNWKTKLA